MRFVKLLIGRGVLGALLLAASLATSERWLSRGFSQTETPAAVSQGEPAQESGDADGSAFIPAALREPITVEFEEIPFSDVVKWIRENRKIDITIDIQSLEEEGLSANEPLTDHLTNEPLYFLLNRLKKFGIGWYVEDGIVIITSDLDASEHLVQASYDISALIAAGYKPHALQQTIVRTIVGSKNTYSDAAVGVQDDLLFVTASQPMQRQVADLLVELRSPRDQRFLDDPPQHLALRNSLEQTMSVKFDEIPLHLVAAKLSQQANVDIRLEDHRLEEDGISTDERMTFEMTDKPLRTILKHLLRPLDCTWKIENGVLWFTPKAVADDQYVTAVYDIEGLCADERDCRRLARMIHEHTTALSEKRTWVWNDDNDGSICFPRPNVMVVRQTEKVHDDILKLLDDFRNQRRHHGSANRNEDAFTRFYRMEKPLADDLVRVLPQLVQPDSWKTDANPTATGTIFQLPALPEPEPPVHTPRPTTSSIPECRTVFKFFGVELTLTPRSTEIKTVSNSTTPAIPQAVSSPPKSRPRPKKSVVAIHQTQAVHDEIDEVLRELRPDAQNIIDWPPKPEQFIGGDHGVWFN